MNNDNNSAFIQNIVDSIIDAAIENDVFVNQISPRECITPEATNTNAEPVNITITAGGDAIKCEVCCDTIRSRAFFTRCCAKIVHTTCFERWVSIHVSCPICNHKYSVCEDSEDEEGWNEWIEDVVPRPISELSLATLQTTTSEVANDISSGSSCGICLVPFYETISTDTEHDVYQMDVCCGTFIHITCFTEWGKTSCSCPMCKYEFISKHAAGEATVGTTIQLPDSSDSDSAIEVIVHRRRNTLERSHRVADITDIVESDSDSSSDSNHPSAVVPRISVENISTNNTSHPIDIGVRNRRNALPNIIRPNIGNRAVTNLITIARYKTVSNLPDYTYEYTPSGQQLIGIANGILTIDSRNPEVSSRILVDSFGARSGVHCGIYRCIDPGSDARSWILQRDEMADSTEKIKSISGIRILSGEESAMTVWKPTFPVPFVLDMTPFDFISSSTITSSTNREMLRRIMSPRRRAMSEPVDAEVPDEIIVESIEDIEDTEVFDSSDSNAEVIDESEFRYNDVDYLVAGRIAGSEYHDGKIYGSSYQSNLFINNRPIHMFDRILIVNREWPEDHINGIYKVTRVPETITDYGNGSMDILPWILERADDMKFLDPFLEGRTIYVKSTKQKFIIRNRGIVGRNTLSISEITQTQPEDKERFPVESLSHFQSIYSNTQRLGEIFELRNLLTRSDSSEINSIAQHLEESIRYFRNFGVLSGTEGMNGAVRRNGNTYYIEEADIRHICQSTGCNRLEAIIGLTNHNNITDAITDIIEKINNRSN